MTVFVKDSIRLGAELPQLSRLWSLHQFQQRHELVYGSGLVVGDAWPERNIHADAEAARREGLAEPVGSAPQLIAMIHRIMMMGFGAGWISGGAISVKMIRPFFAGDHTTARGSVTALAIENDPVRGEDCIRATCKTWVERRDGTPLLVGTASALVV